MIIKRVCNLIFAALCAAILSSLTVSAAEESAPAMPPDSGFFDPEAIPARPPMVDIEPVYRGPSVDTLATIRKRGTLLVGVALSDPMVMHDANGELIGYSVDLARQLADDLGVDLEFVPTSWSQIIPDLLDRRLYLPRGKTLGGCSSTNAMAYVRGNSADYDDWSAMGNPGWSYREILPYFIRSEHNEDIRNAYHGAGGELNTGFAKSFRTPFAEAFVEACVQSGFERNGDYNGEKQEGAGFFQFNIKNGKRHSAATAFLKPVLRRPNLKVFTHTHTRRVLLQKDRATGVEVATKSGEVAVK